MADSLLVKALVCTAVILGSLTPLPLSLAADSPAPELWRWAEEHSEVHRFATLFTAPDVRDRLAHEAGLAAAIDWCQRTAVTHVFIECFRDGKTVLITDGLAARLGSAFDRSAPNVQVLPVGGDPKALLAFPQTTLDTLRAPLLKRFTNVT